jgi:hypothetical protein
MVELAATNILSHKSIEQKIKTQKILKKSFHMRSVRIEL